ncbi:MAG: serine/threonine protein kinase [Gemmatimonadaceae bacterium]|nr:serine/threonine protein kinase [Gemmatimonadaceae bacterium]
MIDIDSPERRRVDELARSNEDIDRDDSVWVNLVDEFLPMHEIRRTPRSTVYRVNDVLRHRVVALEILAPNRIRGEAHAEQFLREAKALIPVKHPHVHTVFAVRQIDESFILVMSDLQARTLAEVMAEQGPLPIDAVLKTATQLGEALDFLVARDIVHGDIRPETIVLTDAGDAVLTDFAFKADRAETEAATVQGTAPTAERMWEADQYALGVVLYKMLTGNDPFEASNVAVPSLLLHRDPPPIRNTRADCSESFEALIMRMMAVQPSDRWPSMTDALSMLSTTPANVGDLYGNVSVTSPESEASIPFVEAPVDTEAIAAIEFIELESASTSGAVDASTDARPLSPATPDAPTITTFGLEGVASGTAPVVPPTVSLVTPPPMQPIKAREEAPAAPAPTSAPVKPAAPPVATADAPPVPQHLASSKPAPKPAPTAPAVAMPAEPPRRNTARVVILFVGLLAAAGYFWRDKLPLPGRAPVVQSLRPLSTYFAPEAMATMYKDGVGIGSPAAAEDFSVSSKDPKLLVVDGRASLAPGAYAYGQGQWRASSGEMAVHFDVWFDRAPEPHTGGIVLSTTNGAHLFLHLLQSTNPKVALTMRTADGDVLVIPASTASTLRAGMNAVDLIVVKDRLSAFINGDAVISTFALPHTLDGRVGVFGSASTGVEFDNLAIANLSRR